MRILIGALLALAILAPDASAKPKPLKVALVPGAGVTFTITDAGVENIQGVAGNPSSFDVAVGAHASANQSPANSGKNFGIIRSGEEGFPPAGPIAKERIAISFVQMKDGGSLLMIENGYDRLFSYHAMIRTKGKNAPTDVCQVIPGKRGYEHWPFAVERIEISAIHLENGDGATGLRCE